MCAIDLLGDTERLDMIGIGRANEQEAERRSISLLDLPDLKLRHRAHTNNAIRYCRHNMPFLLCMLVPWALVNSSHYTQIFLNRQSRTCEEVHLQTATQVAKKFQTTRIPSCLL